MGLLVFIPCLHAKPLVFTIVKQNKTTSILRTSRFFIQMNT